MFITVPALSQQEGVDSALEHQPIPELRGDPRIPQDSQSAAQIGAAIRELTAKQDAPEDKRKEQREIGDLEAQQDMAFWAKAMFWAAALTTFLTFVGVLLIWRTLKHTRTAALAAKDAVDEAKHATAAALAAVEVTGQTAERQLRAYVFAEGSQLVGTPGAEFRAIVIIKNSGQTPAYQVEHWAILGFNPYPNPLDGFFDVPDFTIGRLVGPLAPHGKFEWTFNTESAIPENVLKGIRSGRAAAWLFGQIFYLDAFGHKRSTRYRLYCTGAGSLAKGRFVYASSGNEAI